MAAPAGVALGVRHLSADLHRRAGDHARRRNGGARLAGHLWMEPVPLSPSLVVAVPGHTTGAQSPVDWLGGGHDDRRIGRFVVAPGPPPLDEVAGFGGTGRGLLSGPFGRAAGAPARDPSGHGPWLHRAGVFLPLCRAGGHDFDAMAGPRRTGRARLTIGAERSVTFRSAKGRGVRGPGGGNTAWWPC